jgi:hypothetical protein
MANKEAAELAQKLIQTLRQQRDGGHPYPMTVGQLATQADPQATAELVEKALARKPFAGQVVRARKKDLSCPIALAEDVDRLASSALLLEYTLGRVCRAERPLHPPARLATQVDASLRQAFAEALQRRLAEKSLPESVGVREVRGLPHLYLQALPPPPPKKRPAEELGERLLAALQARRDSGHDYPTTLDCLVGVAAPGVKQALVKQAVSREPFRSQALLAVARNSDAPVALAGDRDWLASSPQLLEYLLAAATTTRRPLAAPARLQEMLIEDLQRPFLETLTPRLERHDLPETVGAFMGATGPELFLKARLPPAAGLAWKLLRTLEARRRMGDYPLLLESLVCEADPEARAEVVAEALKDRTLKPHLLQALAGNPQTPVALAEDAALLADWPGLLEATLQAAVRPENQAVAIGDLKKKVIAPLRTAFAAALDRRLHERALPAGVGLLRIKRTALLFLLADVSTSWPAPEPPAPPPSAAPESPTAADFASRFNEAFTRLDRDRDGNNLVSLVALREAVGVDRTTFDAGLADLRRQGLYGLSAAEGRHGITPEEHDAGVVEDGSLLLFVSRKAN